MDSISGQHIKSYELRECLGTGGFGAVYKAWQTTVGREVAIKIILPDHANQADFIRRFESEAQLVARLEHPYITPLYDYWRDPDGAYLVMRWLRGGSLSDALQNGAFDLPATALLLDQIAGALSLAHRNGVIHRDIKPGNILLDDEGNAYLTDFGIAKDLTLPGNNTQQDAIVGSLDYISPEQARSEPVTPRTDIYSLGVTLYEMITGHHPFANMSSIERLYKHIAEPLPEIDTIERSLQAAVNHVIQKATAKNPERRYADALALAADFREAIGMNRTSTTIEELLTQREHEILQMIIDGLSNKEIAQRLTVTLSTVKWHVYQIYSKLGVRSRVQAIVRARELNLIIKPGETIAAVAIPTEDFHPQNPFKGLLAFRAADSQDFFGREKLIAKLLKRWSETGDYYRFLAVVGPSGSGKSSLVKAGLIPALWRGELPGSEKWFIAEMLPGAHPLEELEVALTRVATHQSGSLNEHLRRDSRGLVRIAGIILPDEETELVLVIDQFEEVFTLLEDEAERTHFLDLLYTAVTEPRSRIRVVITLRADFYDRPLHYPHFGELVRTRLETIMPLSAEELERAIVRPAERVGVTFEPGLVAAIIGDVNYQPGALPLLQYALTELFERRKGRLLLREAYQEIGGTVGALAQRAETIYLSLSESDQELTRQLFLRLVTLGEGTEDTRRRTLRSELLGIHYDSEPIEELLDSFAAYRLLSLDTDTASRQPTVEIAHEALIREWERLKLWLNENRAEIQMQRQLSSLASDWANAKANPSFLLRGSRLANFEAWAKETSFSLTAEESSFLRASSIEHERETQVEFERQAREIRLEQRSRNFLRGLVAVFAIAALIAIGLSIFALRESNRATTALDDAEIARGEAEQNASYARSIALAAAASNAQSLKNPDQAIALAVAANTITENPPAYAQSVLYDLAFKPATRRLLDLETWWLETTPDGRKLVSLLPEQAGIAVVDINTGETLSEWTNPIFTERVICGINISSTTVYLDAIERSNITGEIIAFDLMTGQELRRFAAPPSPEVPDCRFGFSPDGRSLIDTTSTFQDGIWPFASVITWDIATGEIIHSFRPDTTGLDNAVELGYSRFARSANAQKLLIAYDTGQVVMWDVTTGERIGTYGDARTHITTTAFSEVIPAYTPYGIVVSASDRGEAYSTSVTLWDEETGALLNEATLEAPLTGLELSPDGQTLQLGLMSYQNILINLDKWQMLELYGNQGNAGDAYFLPNGQLISTGADIRLWNLENGAELQRFEGMTNFLGGMAISPDGHTLAAQQYIEGGAEAPLILWDMETGEILRTLTNNESSMREVVYSPDGRFIFSTSNHNQYEVPPCSKSHAELQLMDAETGELIWEATKQGGTVFGEATFTQDGSRILTTDWTCDNLIMVWNAETGEVLETWDGHQAPIWTVSASPDGKWIVSGDVDGNALLRDSDTGEIIRTFSHQATVATAVFSPDSHLLLTADTNSLMHLWDVATGQEIRQLTGHTGFIIFVEFSPDGRYLVSSSGGDGNIFVWDLATGEIIRRINQPLISPIGSPVEFSPNGQSIFYADENNVIHQVDLMLDGGELLQWVIDNRYVRDLTCQERQLYQVEPLCEVSEAQASTQP